MEFTVDRRLVEGVEVLEVEGVIDLYTAPILRKILLEVLAVEGVSVVLDLDGVDSLDSTALGVLAIGLKRTRENGGSLQLVCTHVQILYLFRIIGFNEKFGIHPSVQAAVAAIRKPSQ
ncbi:STAS domain-containing protein [Nonomuraea sp. NPDC005650]|uniref:STAS domain-containing protein n=1 Tax=Nonomuraea sp. NPDC005650 TaxID=3157045 RepID=UPI0033B9AF02